MINLLSGEGGITFQLDQCLLSSFATLPNTQASVSGGAFHVELSFVALASLQQVPSQLQQHDEQEINVNESKV